MHSPHTWSVKWLKAILETNNIAFQFHFICFELQFHLGKCNDNCNDCKSKGKMVCGWPGSRRRWSGSKQPRSYKWSCPVCWVPASASYNLAYPGTRRQAWIGLTMSTEIGHARLPLPKAVFAVNSSSPTAKGMMWTLSAFRQGLFEGTIA